MSWPLPIFRYRNIFDLHLAHFTEFAPRPNAATLRFADSTQACLGKLGGSQLIANNGANFLIAVLRD